MARKKTSFDKYFERRMKDPSHRHQPLGIVMAQGGGFDFLGHAIRPRGKETYFDISKKALARIRSELRRKTRRTYLSLSALVKELNAYLRGVRQYFRRVLRRRLHSLDFFINERIARWWKRKRALRRPAWSLVQKGALQRQYGLERL